MNCSVQEVLELHENRKNGTKRSKIRRIFHSLSGRVGSEISENGSSVDTLYVETPLTSPQEEHCAEESSATLSKIKALIRKSRRRYGENLIDKLNSTGDQQSYRNTFQRVVANYKKYRNTRVKGDTIDRNDVRENSLSRRANNDNIKPVSTRKWLFKKSLSNQKHGTVLISSKDTYTTAEHGINPTVANCETGICDCSSIPNLSYETESVSTSSDNDRGHILNLFMGKKSKIYPHCMSKADSVTSGPSYSQSKNNSSNDDFKHMRIPTFRNETGLEIRSIVSTIQGGTLTEQSLMNLTCEKKKSFMDAKFYDEESNSEDSESEQPPHSINSTSRSNRYLSGNKVESVKFDTFSHLVIYDASKKCIYSPSTDQLTLTIPNDNITLQNKGQTVESKSNERTGKKSILKKSINEQEFIEAERARKCDEVGADEFLEFVVKHENEKRRGDSILATVREKQLQKYYDDVLCPSIKIEPNKCSSDNSIRPDSCECSFDFQV